MTQTFTPFLKTTELTRHHSADLAVRHDIDDTAADWLIRLHTDLSTTLLDDLYGYLWLIARKSGSHIDALHVHVFKKRCIIVVEDPKLHMVWYYDTLYLKPLPDYLLNHDIWTRYIPKSTAGAAAQPGFDLYRSALGFLRSYALLIRYESDYLIAQKAGLIPRYVSFQKWQAFARPFRKIPDAEVAPRYHYGQFRLSRLNLMMHLAWTASWFVKMRPQGGVPWEYQEQIWQTGQFLQMYAAPLILIFATLSVVLSAMQVVLAARGDDTWEAFKRASWGFSAVTIVFALLPFVGTILVFFVVLISQGQFAFRMRWKGRSSGQVP